MGSLKRAQPRACAPPSGAVIIAAAMMVLPGGAARAARQSLAPSVPVLVSPRPQAVTAPEVTFVLQSDDPPGHPVSFEIAVSGRPSSLFATPPFAKGQGAYTAPLDGAGTFTWQARARDAVTGATGAWSSARTLIVSGGVDVCCTDKSFDFWQRMVDHGWSIAVCDAWGGRGSGVGAQAPDNIATALAYGIRPAAYCLLNFDNTAFTDGIGNTTDVPPVQAGDWQMMQAFAAIGDAGLIQRLAFMVLDIEIANDSFHVTVDPVQRIDEALGVIRTFDTLYGANLTPVFYTNQGQWFRIVRTYAPMHTRDFAAFPLWWVRYAGTGVLGEQFTPFAGWTRPVGKQYRLDTTLYGESVDLDVFDPALFR